MEIATVVGKGVNGEGCCVQESVRKWAKACLVGMIARVLVYVARDEGIYRELIDQSALVVESDAARCKGRGRLKDVLSDDGKADEGRKG